jgi:syntaxin-binding protein 5
VFGQARVHVKFALLRKASVKALQLCNSRVVVLDSKNDITVFDLQASGASGVGYSPPGVVTTMCTDPCLDWLFLGLQNGEVIAYDVDREALSPFRIPNFWRERSPRARLLPVVSLMLHPKDVGTLLIAYLEGVVVYSLKQNAVVHYLEFELPPGAPGADTELSVIRTSRKPRVSQAVWHPTGTFICTTYEDSVMAIWNSKDGTIVQARTLQGSGVHLPGRLPEMNMFNDSDDISVRQSIFKIAWCSTNNPDDTSLLIAGGNFMTVPRKGMTLLELGPSPNMLASSVKFVSDHFASPHGQRSLPIPSDLDVIDFCLISRSSPHYGGAHDPVAIIALLVSGELVMLGFPDGQALSPSSLLNPSFSLAHPFASRIDVSAVDRTRWLGMVPSQHGPADMVVGGMEHPKPLRRYGSRVIVQSSHPNGMVRIWDVGHADQVENGAVVELDVGRALQKTVDLKIEAVSMAGNTGETAVGMETGEVVVFRWGYNKLFGHTAEYTGTTTKPLTEEAISFKEGLTDVNMWADPALKEGLLPVCVLDQKCGSVVALKISDVGFCAVAYQTGHLCVLDMRVRVAYGFTAHILTLCTGASCDIPPELNNDEE